MQSQKTVRARARTCLTLLLGVLALPAATQPGDPSKRDSTGNNAPTVGLEREPYLQSMGTDSVIVAWIASPGEQVLEYGPSPAFGMSVTVRAEDGRFAALLRDLRPGGTYHYRIRAAHNVLAGGPDYTFRTDAGATDGAFSFFVTADIGAKAGKQQVTANDILATSPLPEFGLLSGDIVYNSGKSRDYDKRLMQPWADLLRRIPVWPALGNHDWKSDPSDNWHREWYLPNNEHYYSFDYGNAHFIALDTRDGKLYERRAQVAWLERDLVAHRDAAWTFVYFHHPGITCTYKGNNEAVIHHLMPVFDRFHVDVVFTGHAHTYERLYPIRNGEPVDAAQDPHYVDPSGTLYVVSGAGGKVKKRRPTRPCGPTAFFKDQTILWTHVSVDGPTCSIRTYRSANHELLDEASITKSRLARLKR